MLEPFDVVRFVQQTRAAVSDSFSHLPDLAGDDSPACRHILIKLERGVIEISKRRVRGYRNIHNREVLGDILMEDTTNKSHRPLKTQAPSFILQRSSHGAVADQQQVVAGILPA